MTYGLNGISRSRSNLPDARNLMGRVPDTESVSADGRGLYKLGATNALIALGLGLCSQKKR